MSNRDRRQRLLRHYRDQGFLLIGILVALALMSPQAQQAAQVLMSWSRVAVGN